MVVPVCQERYVLDEVGKDVDIEGESLVDIVGMIFGMTFKKPCSFEGIGGLDFGAICNLLLQFFFKLSHISNQGSELKCSKLAMYC